MGALCSKSTSDPFAQPGRTLASAPPPPKQTSSLPPAARKVGGPARTLGGSSPGSGAAAAGTAEEQAEKRRKMAEAAEARFKAPKGKLGQQLDKQRKQTRSDTLEAAASEQVRLRDADAAAEARAHN